MPCADGREKHWIARRASELLRGSSARFEVGEAAAGGEARRERQVLALVVRQRFVRPVEKPERRGGAGVRPELRRESDRVARVWSDVIVLLAPFEPERGDLLGDETHQEHDDGKEDQQDGPVRDA